VSIEDIIERRKEELMRETYKRLEQELERVRGEVQRALDELKEASKIALPVNLLQILAKGGMVKVKEFELRGGEYGFDVYLDRGHVSVSSDTPLSKGRYRAILIVEKLGE